MNHLQSCPERQGRSTVGSQPCTCRLALNRKRPRCPDSQLHLSGQVGVVGGYTPTVSCRFRVGRWLLRIQAVPLAIRANKRLPCVCWICGIKPAGTLRGGPSCWCWLQVGIPARGDWLCWPPWNKRRLQKCLRPQFRLWILDALWRGLSVRAGAHGGTPMEARYLSRVEWKW